MKPNALMKEESFHVYNCDNERQINAKVCEGHGIDSLKYVQPACYCRDIDFTFHTLNMALNKTNCFRCQSEGLWMVLGQ